MHLAGAVDRMAAILAPDAALVVGDAKPVLLDFLDMLRPRIDEGDILTGLRHMRAGIAADRPGADDDDSLAHGSLPASALGTIVAFAGAKRQCADTMTASRLSLFAGMPILMSR